MARRLATDAKIVLERAGYTVQRSKNGSRIYNRMHVGETPALLPHTLIIEGGTVDNDEVVKLLDARGYCEEDGQFHPTDADIGIYD